MCGPWSDTDRTVKILFQMLRMRLTDGIVSKLDKEKMKGFSKKKSKSSNCSIAALCLISINIGENLPKVSQSPGMMSLNSVGTISHTHTPDRDQTMRVMFTSLQSLYPGIMR